MTEKKPKPPMPVWMIGVVAVLAVLAVVYATWETPPQAPPGQSQKPPSSPTQPPATQAALPASDATYEEWVAAGDQRMDSRMFADAVTCYSRALALDSSNADVWVDRGACKHGLGEAFGAIEDLRRALEIEPMHQIAHFNLGIVFLTSGAPDSARIWWNRLLLVAPSGREADRARALLAQMDSVEAADGQAP
jgi:Flp pilus assembly protein TadD